MEHKTPPRPHYLCPQCYSSFQAEAHRFLSFDGKHVVYVMQCKSCGLDYEMEREFMFTGKGQFVVNYIQYPIEDT